MLSDESSSDSETGRFKCRSKNQEEQVKTNKKEEDFRSARRHRPVENERFRKDFDNKRDYYERQRYSRRSPVDFRNRHRHSRDRNLIRKSSERHKSDRYSRGRSKPRELRSSSRDRRTNTRSRVHKSPYDRRDIKEEIKQTIISASSRDRNPEKSERKSKERKSVSPNSKKRSEVHKPASAGIDKKKSESPVVVEEHEVSDISEEVQPGSYYSMIPAVVKEKSEESSEIDSSDDERLRAKLLNLEKELSKTKKKKHKKKHKRKGSKSKEGDRDTSTSVEVSSTTDIQDKAKTETSEPEVAEVTSTQKSNQKESSEEGEITSDDDSQTIIEIDPTDLRHKLKRSVGKKPDVCGPALPPHLEKRYKESPAHGKEGPALPPHLQKMERHIGPSIPEDMRKVLACSSDRQVIKYENSDEDVGIGPLPTGAEDKWSDAHKKLEERALDMKIRKMDGHTLQNSQVKSREQWMLELPEAKAKYLGLEARTFRAKEGPDMSDRSSWTDTPEEKARKAAGIPKEEDVDVSLRRDARARHINTRDEEQEKAVKKHKKKHKREDSLLEIHQKKLKKKKKKEEKEDDKKERRPFSRDIDLQVNRFDDAQKKSIIKKAQELNTRFSRGEAKYL